ncbi:PREDICTED: DNA ligase 3 [Dufourea novaeangliae]|uniref:DNA ligase n=1 Tax=Dufourea novaeangliae TaxID=178035 RepID=A0A154PUH1_DUFNO|nr:PREDICTED: DNA ligase 3 [Dufourea novaeangliae]KZC14850.1 DNA ligase 3 [Dufourea novaeangliae]
MSDEEKEEEQPFAVETAKTGRAKCKKCKCPIEKDTVRIAKLMANPFSEGKMKAWHHVTCLFEVFAKQRATTKRIDDPEVDINGWTDLCDEDKRTILLKIEEFENSAPFKTPKGKTEDSQKKRKTSTPVKGTSIDEKPKKVKRDRSTSKEGSSDGSHRSKKVRDEPPGPSRDDSFEEFQRVCKDVAKLDAYTDKTAVVRRMLTNGSDGAGFKGDAILWCRLLLPGAVKRVYNLQSKQLVKLFSRLLLQDEDEMLEHLEKGDVAETIRVFFEKSVVVQPARKSVLTVQEVDQFLEDLTCLTKEDEQILHFRSIVSRCTSDDLRMIVRLIKHDLRINAGPKNILAAVDNDAYKAFQTSRDLVTVLERCLQGSKIGKPSSSSAGSSSGNKVSLSLMTPVLPMLAEACKSVEMAMKKCPNGMLSEVKYDGERVQVHKRGGEFRYFSRSLKPVLAHKVNHFKEYIPKAFPDGDDLILDSEILMIDTKTGQPLPFGSLGIHKKSEFKNANVCLFVFDCIYYNGDVLLHKTMTERREILQKRMTEIPNRIMLSEVQIVHDPRDLAEMIGKVLKMGLEGLVLKDISSKYEPGKRHWLKVKKDYLFGGAMADNADLVVLGAWYGTGNKGGMMSVFLMGCYDEEHRQWVTVSKVHTGHDDATMTMLQDELDMIKIGKDPSKVPPWLRANKPMIPDFVARDPKKQPVWEITGAEFTNQGVHTADGISIRFPRVTRIRDDKDWSMATTLNELRDLFKKSSDSIDLSLLLPSGSGDVKKEGDGSKPGKLDAYLTAEKRIDEKPESPMKRNKTPRASNTPTSSKQINEVDRSGNTTWNGKMKEEPRDGVKADTSSREQEVEEEVERPKYYAFVNGDYIEYSGAGAPLNWVEGRKPTDGLPTDAKPLSSLGDNELKSRTILKGAPVLLASGFRKTKRKHIRRLLKTLGARLLRDQERSMATHVIHPCKEISSSAVHEYEDVSRTARHVSVEWLEASASASRIQGTEEHAVELTGDYCVCPCRHR